MATILVVDDIPSNRAVLADLLGHFGHRLAEASDGAEALERALAVPGPVQTAEHAAAFERERRRLAAQRPAGDARRPGGAGERFVALTELNLSLASERDPEELLDAVYRGARRLIGARYAAIEVRATDGRDPGFGRLAGFAPPVAGEPQALALCEGSLGQPTPASRACRLHPLNGDAAVLGLPSRLPVDALEIDRSFVAAMQDSPGSLTIVSTIVTLARSLGLHAIAEGVETAAQAERLRAVGCDQLQGYFLGRPVPFDELHASLS